MEKQGIIKVFEDLEELMGTPVPTIVEDFLRSAIETAFKEVRPEERDESPHNGNPMWERNVGHNSALSDYDQAVDKYLGK